MKKLFISIVAVGLALTAGAQQTDKQMATLQHGDKTTVYYGIDAFKQAYNAAADTLDVITLSSGEFNVPETISKSLAIYGAGFERDTITQQDKTFLRSSVTLIPANSKNSDDETILAAKRINGSHLEGLYVEGDIIFENNNNEPVHNVSIAKCRAWSVSFRTQSFDCVVRQCQLGTVTGHSRNYAYTFVAKNLLVSNCWLEREVFNFPSESTILIDHCLLKGNETTYPYTYTNCIVYGTQGNNSVLYNNVFITSQEIEQGDFGAQDLHGNWVGVENKTFYADESENGGYSSKKTYTLRYPEVYRGNDGTEIGLHGGVYAWNKTPCIPRITECTIDTENASNGTIKVSIKAEAQTKE